MVEIVPITADDWREWRRVRLRALREAAFAFAATFEEWAEAPEARWRARLSIPKSVNYVARLDGASVGLASGLPEDAPGEVKLTSLWVDPAVRGSGVVDTLIEAVEEWATCRGAHLSLDVLESNSRAIVVYERHGFERTGARVLDAPNEIVMAKPYERADGRV